MSLLVTNCVVIYYIVANISARRDSPSLGVTHPCWLFLVMTVLTLAELRQAVTDSWEDVVVWFSAKPRVFRLPRPEQQINFELGCRLRERLRRDSGQSRWDRLYFDGAACSLSEATHLEAVGHGVPIYVDAHRLYGMGSRDHRDSHMPDLAVAVHVLRSVHELLDMDEDGRPRHQNFIPQSMRVQGWKLEEQVRTFEQMAEQEVASFLFVVYSNQAQRQTAVEKREVASWAAWTEVDATLWCASRFFRQRGSSRP